MADTIDAAASGSTLEGPGGEHAVAVAGAPGVDTLFTDVNETYPRNTFGL